MKPIPQPAAQPNALEHTDRLRPREHAEWSG